MGETAAKAIIIGMLDETIGEGEGVHEGGKVSCIRHGADDHQFQQSDCGAEAGEGGIGIAAIEDVGEALVKQMIGNEASGVSFDLWENGV